MLNNSIQLMKNVLQITNKGLKKYFKYCIDKIKLKIIKEDLNLFNFYL